jgi:hypothetical protein
MMKAVDLKSRSVFPKVSLELPFPESDPLLDRNRFIERRTEEVKMIRHDHVGTDHPPVSLAPCSQQGVMESGIRQALLPMLRTDRYKDDCCLAAKNENPFGWMFSLPQLPRLD